MTHRARPRQPVKGLDETLLVKYCAYLKGLEETICDDLRIKNLGKISFINDVAVFTILIFAPVKPILTIQGYLEIALELFVIITEEIS